MIRTQLALIRREIWEHRSLYVVPAVLALVVTLMSITGQVVVSSVDEQVDLALLGASNISDVQRAALLNVVMLAQSWIFVLTMGVIIVFYALDALYAERKDKSILFWRSLPVSDFATVLSKLLTAGVVVPLITVAVIAVTHVLVLSVASLWVGMRGADAWHLIWASAPIVDNWSATLIVVAALSLWFAPFVGWFLFVSAFAKRSPFLLAFLPLVIVPMLEKILLGSSLFGRMLLERAPFSAPIIRRDPIANIGIDNDEDLLELAQSGVSLMSMVDVGRFLSSPALWTGLVVCALFCAAAIYVRRFRDDT